LPAPVRGGSLDELRPFVNLAGDDDWRLLAAWLVAALRPRGPYPLLCLHGEQGSSKSTTARVVRALIDPSSAPLRAEPRDEHDLIIAATNSWVVAFDNLSQLSPRLSDALCRLSTGGGFATRELYTDADEVLFEAQRPVLLTGIEDLATRGDLLDRALVLQLPALAEEERRPEAEFWRAFEAVRPRILGGLLDAAATALARLPAVRLGRLPRMADFAVWATAAEAALGWEEGAFVRSYTANRREVNFLSLEDSVLVPPLRELVGRGGWEGSCTELLAELARGADEKAVRSRGWPSSARLLSNALRRLAPNLRRAGIAVEFSRLSGRQGRRVAVREIR
jgi:hypothetical protein